MFQSPKSLDYSIKNLQNQAEFCRPFSKAPLNTIKPDV